MGFNEGFTSLKGVIMGLENIEAMGILMELQQQAYAVLDENRELRLKIEELERNQITELELEYSGDAYYRNEDGPYCTRCWDVDQKLVRLSTLPRTLSPKGTHKCTNCDSSFTIVKNQNNLNAPS